MRRLRKAEVSEEAQKPPQVLRSNRKRKAVEETQDQPSTSSPVLRRSKRIRDAVQETSIFDTPPPSSKKQNKIKISVKKPAVKKKSQVLAQKPVVMKSRQPPPTMMTLPYELQEKLLRYLDVAALESLSKTCSHFDLMINGRYLTSLGLPLDQVFLKEVAESTSLEKKPLLRLECKKPREEAPGDYEPFLSKFVDCKRSLREYIIHSQMALLSLHKVREIDLVAKDFRPEDLKNASGMLESYQAFDKIILRHMFSLGNLGNISRLDIMLVEEDFSQTMLKEFMPSFTNLLELNITIGERRNSLRSYFYGSLEDIVMATKAPLLKLTVLGATKKNFPKVFNNNHIEKLVVSAPCNFSLSLIMKNLREVVLEMAGPEDSGDCCSLTNHKTRLDDRKMHRTGLCIIHVGSLYKNCPKIQTFDGVEIGQISQRKLTFPKWNSKLRKIFYEDYTKKGGGKDFPSWSKSRWFSRMPSVSGVFGSYRYPGPCIMM